MTERWADVLGYEGIYEVSDEGRIRSLPRVVCDGSHRAGRELRSHIASNGYAMVTLCRGGHEKSQTVHRIVAEAWCVRKNDTDEVCHNDGNRENNAASNLRWDTHRENMRDQVKHGSNARVLRTVCPEGHTLFGQNLRQSELAKGRRSCRACQLGRRRSSKQGRTFTPGDADDIYARLMAS